MRTDADIAVSEENARPSDLFGRVLHQVALALAIFGGLVLLVIVGINSLSIAGRFLFSSPLVGDFELVELGCAVAVSSFLPLCHLRSGNVIVDFVTARLPSSFKDALDALSALIFGMIAGFFTWRMCYGAQDMYRYREETMLLQVPLWIPFLPVVFSFLVLSICCFYTFFIDVTRVARRV